HQSYYVNMFYIKEIGKNYINLKTKKSLPMSPKKRNYVLSQFNIYLNK
ncbi:DNA-binding response regulator, partial [Coprobacillus sp. AM42-12AC]